MEQPDPMPVALPAPREDQSAVRAPRRERLSWALYGFSDTLFSMNVTTLYFSAWLVYDLGASNTLYAAGNAIASLLVVFSIPVLGALSDERRRRKPWVVGFTLAASAACAAIGILGQRLPRIGTEVIAPLAPSAGWHAGPRELFWVLAAFVIADFAFQAAQPFYNAMMPDLVPVEERGRLSGLGAAVGYIGSIVGVLLVIPFFNGSLPIIGKLSTEGMRFLRAAIPFTTHGGRVSTFVPTAILFVAFSMPFFVFCRDRHPAPPGTRLDWRKAFREVAHTIHDAKQHPGTLRFIITSFVYQDAIGTIVGFMALYAIKAVGFGQGTETTLFLVLTIPSVLGSYIYGHVVDRLGPKRSLSITLGVWITLLACLIAVPGKAGFWVIGFLIGLNYGGVQTSERTVLVSLVPAAEGGRYFSLMLLSSRAAAIVGPLIWATTVDGLESRFGTAIAYRAAVLTVVAMFSVAAWLLRRVPNVMPARA